MNLVDCVFAYSSLSDITTQLCTIKSSQIKDESVKPLPPQDGTDTWLKETKDILDRCLSIINQYQVLLDSCPESTNENGDQKLLSPCPMESLSVFEKMNKGDEGWLKMMERLTVGYETY